MIEEVTPENGAHRLLGSVVMATWLVSLFAWLYVIISILRFDLIGMWPLGFIAFVISFASMVIYWTYWRPDLRERSLLSRFIRACLLSTWIHSLLLFAYLVARVITDNAPLSSPFIDILLPWFTFFRLGALALIIGVVSLFAYLIFFWRFDIRSMDGVTDEEGS